MAIAAHRRTSRRCGTAPSPGLPNSVGSAPPAAPERSMQPPAGSEAPNPAAIQREPSPAPSFSLPSRPSPGSGGGGLRSASLLEYLRQRLFGRRRSTSLSARIRRVCLPSFGAIRCACCAEFRRCSTAIPAMKTNSRGAWATAKYDLGVVEHFWCAGYAPLLRAHCQHAGSGSAQHRK